MSEPSFYTSDNKIPSPTGEGRSGVLLSIAYLPPVEWFARIIAGDAIIEVCDNYIKQTYRNRCHIATPNGMQPLTIPVTHDGCVGIREQAAWRHNHWQALVSAYRMSPFFDYYADDLYPFYASPRTETLYEYDLTLIQTLLRLMHIDMPLRLSTHYRTADECKTEGILDLREVIHPKKDTSHKATEYYQVFKDKTGFIPNLSIVDLLFNMGPEAKLILANKYIE